MLKYSRKRSKTGRSDPFHASKLRMSRNRRLPPIPGTGLPPRGLFVARFHMGKGAEGSPMPWRAFSRMNDQDLQAIYRYLKTVPGVENDTGDSVRTSTVASK